MLSKRAAGRRAHLDADAASPHPERCSRISSFWGGGMLLEGKRVVVTGASRGLGRAFAVALAAEGASVVINGTNEALLDETRRIIEDAGGTTITHVGSVAEHATCEQIIQACVDAFGGIDVLVNNAGIVRDRTFLKMSEADFDEVIAVNLKGTWACGQAAARAMSTQGGGHIINIISAAGQLGAFGQNNYAASKAGAVALTFTWAIELPRYNIRSNAIWPLALTDMTDVVLQMARANAEKDGEPSVEPQDMGLGNPDEVATLLVHLCSDDAGWMNGQVLSFNGRRVALWTHPAEINERRRDHWTVEDFQRDLQKHVVPKQEPVGQVITP
ncbi:MAG: SDR family oxidoreductase [Dehalococcoidia bacterium]|nr:SDR family oxidoreductase [Dehalococcoidia bacterium]